jgi:hypothetical protein
MGSWTPASSTVGIDIWQVNSGSVFDNIVAANLDEVNAIDKTWTPLDGDQGRGEGCTPTEYTKVEDTDDKNEKDDDDKEGL